MLGLARSSTAGASVDTSASASLQSQSQCPGTRTGARAGTGTRATGRSGRSRGRGAGQDLEMMDGEGGDIGQRRGAEGGDILHHLPVAQTQTPITPKSLKKLKSQK